MTIACLLANTLKSVIRRDAGSFNAPGQDWKRTEHDGTLQH
jgi:hypothetical protein